VQGHDKTATCCVLHVLREMHKMFLNFFSSSNKISCMWPVATKYYWQSNIQRLCWVLIQDLLFQGS